MYPPSLTLSFAPGANTTISDTKGYQVAQNDCE